MKRYRFFSMLIAAFVFFFTDAGSGNGYAFPPPPPSSEGEGNGPQHFGPPLGSRGRGPEGFRGRDFSQGSPGYFRARRPSMGPPPNRLTDALDSDGNGELSAAEVENAVAALLTLVERADFNEDGYIEAYEIDRMVAERKSKPGSDANVSVESSAEESRGEE